jgi:hypothetical protein
VRVLQGQSGFPDGERPPVVFLGISVPTLARAETAEAMQPSAQCGCPGGSFDSRTCKDLLRSASSSSNRACSVRTSARRLGGENAVQTRATAELVVNLHGLRQARIRFGQAKLREIKPTEI